MVKIYLSQRDARALYRLLSTGYFPFIGYNVANAVRRFLKKLEEVQ